MGNKKGSGLEDIDTELDDILAEGEKAIDKDTKPKKELKGTDYALADVDDIAIPEKTLRIIPNEEIDALADSIKNDGLLQPIIVSKDGELVAGYRRLLACKKLKLDKIKVNVSEFEKEDRYRVSVVENIQRKQLSTEEEARSYANLLEDKKKFPTQKALAKALGVSETKISLSLKAIGETKEYPAATEKREAKKAEKAKKPRMKSHRMAAESLPEGMTVVVSKNEINIGIKIKIKNNSHAESFEIKKEIDTVLKEVSNKDFVEELQILREKL